MHGYQHKKMGIAAGVGVLAFTILAKAPPESTLCMVTIPMGAMLPDIDHDRSKIGRARKKATGLLKVSLYLVVIGFIISSYLSGGIVNALLNSAYVGGMFLIISIINRNKHVKKQLGFITKHRGIMHTLIPCMFLLGTTIWTGESLYFLYGMYGLAFGYFVHLLGDMATEEGAPILWPLIKVNIRYSSFNTNKHPQAIEMVCNIWCVLFVVAGVYLGMKGGF